MMNRSLFATRRASALALLVSVWCAPTMLAAQEEPRSFEIYQVKQDGPEVSVYHSFPLQAPDEFDSFEADEVVFDIGDGQRCVVPHDKLEEQALKIDRDGDRMSIAIVMDRTGKSSMGALSGATVAAVERFTNTLLAQRSGDEFMLHSIYQGSKPGEQLEFTTDPSAVSEYTTTLKKPRQGSSSVYKQSAAALDVLGTSSKPLQSMIIISDGVDEDNALRDDKKALIDKARALDIPISTVWIDRTGQRKREQKPSELGKPALEEIAEQTGGVFRQVAFKKDTDKEDNTNYSVRLQDTLNRLAVIYAQMYKTSCSLCLDQGQQAPGVIEEPELVVSVRHSEREVATSKPYRSRSSIETDGAGAVCEELVGVVLGADTTGGGDEGEEVQESSGRTAVLVGSGLAGFLGMLCLMFGFFTLNRREEESAAVDGPGGDIVKPDPSLINEVPPGTQPVNSNGGSLGGRDTRVTKPADPGGGSVGTTVDDPPKPKPTDPLPDQIGRLVSKDGSQKDIIVVEGEQIIGAGAECDVVLKVETISTAHAVLEYKGGKLQIEDLDSSNGTFLYEPIPGGQWREHSAKPGQALELRDGDELAFSHRVRFKVELKNQRQTKARLTKLG